MNKLISIQGYIKKEFAQNSISPITLRKKCKEGRISSYPNAIGAKKIEGTWWIIYEDKIQTTGNNLVDRVLCG
jgi:hypothetical protein